MASKNSPSRPPPPIPMNVVPPTVKDHFEHLQQLTKYKVRWFYQEEKKWVPFKGYDSLVIENAYRLLPSSLQSPMLDKSDIDKCSIKKPVVRGSLFEVDLLKRECCSLFWRENNMSVMRGTWFKGSISGNWEPIAENEASKIEEAHCNVVKSLGVGSDNLNSSSNALHQIKIGVHRIEWHELSQVYMVSETAGSRIAQKIGLSGAQELHRGYKVDCSETDKLGDITHIVFLVHGMGQLYHGEGGIVNSRKKLIDAVDKAGQRFFKQEQEAGHRIEFFPVEWRSMLKLDEGIIESITPSNLSSLRKVINDTTLDVFYYTSPFFREEIVSTMRQQLNNIYKAYTEKNPSFVERGGKVSIIAHSLGSVIIYDVLTFWNSYLIEKDKKNADVQVADVERSLSWFWGWGRERSTKMTASSTSIDLNHQLHDARMRVAKLENQIVSGVKNTVLPEECYSLLFKVENVLNIGSPLGVFLVMRGIRPRVDVEQHILPTSVCKRIFNIFDPADPVAYRLEPLIYDYYKSVPPVRLAHVSDQLEETNLKSGVQSPGAGGGWLKAIFGGNKEAQPLNIQYKSSSEVEIPKSKAERVDELLSGKRVLLHRLDYVLEQSMVEYFSAITSHQAYWHNQDFGKFVLQAIYAGSNDDINSRL